MARVTQLREWLRQSLSNSLARRITLYAVGLAAGVVLTIGAISYGAMSVLLHGHLDDDVQARLQLKTQRLQHELSAFTNDIAGLAGNSLIVHGLIDSQSREIYLLPFLRDYKSPMPVPVTVVLCDFLGRPVASNGPRMTESYARFAAVKAALDAGRAHAEVLADEPVLLLAQPIFYPGSQRVEGVLIGRVNLADVLIVGADVLDWKYHTRLLAGETLLAGSGGRLLSVEEVRLSKPLALGTALDALGFKVSIGVERAEAFSTLSMVTWSYLAIGAITLLVVFMCARYMASSLVRPLMVLSRTARQISATGVTDIRAPVSGTDEVGSLAAVFNQMLDRLSAFQELLQQRIAERTAANQELERAKVAAEEAARAKSAFLATMSHEIRTPMNGVLGMVDVLEHTQLTAQQSDLVGAIQESGNVLLRLIDDILDFSKIEAGQLPELERAPVSLEDMVEGVCHSLVRLAIRSDIDLDLFVSPELPRRVLSDEVRLRQVLYNVVGNAIKFSGGRAERRGRVSVRIEHVAAAPLRVAFTVADNGIGIAPETLARLFTPFTQGEDFTTRRFGGTGLGLAICKRLVDMMQGEIAVQSEAGVGSTFTITLPFAVSPEEPVADLPDLAGQACIIVESARLNAANLRAYLEHAGAHVQQAADAGSAVRLAANVSAPVVVILGAGDERFLLDEAFTAASNVRPLLITRGQRRRPRVEDSGVVALDGDVFRRVALLQAVVVAAGRASPAILNDAKHEAARADSAPPMAARDRSDHRRILVAEDDKMNQKVIVQQLSLLGYAVEVAANGAVALDLWRSGRYALLLTDLHMPEMDGYTLAETIRREEAGKSRTPILALTANALRDETQRAWAAGMDEYLVKPVRLPLLRAALQKWMAQVGGSNLSALQQEARGGVASPYQQARRDDATPAVDVAALKNLVGDEPGVVRRFLHEYLAAARCLTMQLRAASAAGDAAQVRTIAHRMKSSARIVGALALSDCCAELESAGRIGDSTAIAQRIPHFDAAVTAVEVSIDKVLAQQA